MRLCIIKRALNIQRFFESEGVELNKPESIPSDPYLEQRFKSTEVPSSTTKSTFDARRQHCELDRQILRFYAVWDDRKEVFGDLRKFTILVSLIF